MKSEQAGFTELASLQDEIAETAVLEQARQIEKEMFHVMTTQVKLAIMQVVLGALSIVLALVIAMLQ